MQYLTTANGPLYALVLLVIVLMVLFHKRIHNAVVALEAFVNAHLPAPVAAVVDAGLNKLDQMAQQPTQQNVSDLFNVLKELVHAGVQNANVTTVNQAKQAGLFTEGVAAAVKADVCNQVLNNLGPLKDVLQANLGDLAPIVEQMIETKVQEIKKTA